MEGMFRSCHSLKRVAVPPTMKDLYRFDDLSQGLTCFGALIRQDNFERGISSLMDLATKREDLNPFCYASFRQ